MKIKSAENEIEINILQRSNPDTDDYWDANWLESVVTIHVTGFQCSYSSNLRVEDFQRFHNDLIMLKNLLKKEIEFTTMEEGLNMHFQTDQNGLITCNGKAKNDAGNCLSFQFVLDITSLENCIGELEALLRSYPIIGSLD